MDGTKLMAVALALALAGCIEGSLEGPNSGVWRPGAIERQRDDSRRPSLASLFQCETPDGTLSPRIVRLNHRQYAATMEMAFGEALAPSALPFALINTADRFSTLARSYRVGEADVETVVNAARESAALAVARLSAGDSCLGGAMPLETCLREEVRARGAVLFHRPLSDDEVDTYVAAATATGRDLDRETAAATAFEAMLRAPQFLYRTELGTPGGDGAFVLTPHEIASAVSYTLTDAPPDGPLLAAADSGALREPAEIERQVERLLADAAESDALLRFVRELAGYPDAAVAGKPESEFPAHDGDLLVADTDHFVRSVLATHARSGFLFALLTSDAVFVRPATAWSYGLDELAGEGVREMTFPGERAGLLLQPSWLVAWSEPDKNMPIQRGKFLRETFLCEDLPPLPIPDIEPLAPADGQTLRETLAQHRENAACAACHDRMDPLGLPFEQFDHLGRFRTEELGRPVVTTGALDSSGPDTDGDVAGPIDLVTRLAASPVARQCFVSHAYEFWIGERPSEAIGCALVSADDRFQRDQDLVGLIASFFTADAFLRRIEETDR